MIPTSSSVTAINESAEYERVGSQSFACYPGWATLEVFRHKTSGMLVGRNVFMDDDSSDHESARPWFEVTAETRTVYQKKP